MPRILLIEDNQHFQRIYTAKFRSEGFDITIAENGEQGLACIEGCQPDAILLDIMMPKMDGFEVLKRFHSDTKLSRIPVFMLSNKAWPDDVQHALALGARQFYAKGSSSLQDIAAQIRSECGFKKVMVLGNTAQIVNSVVQALRHPNLLAASNTVMAEVVTAIERGSPDLVILVAAPSAANAFTILQQLKTTPSTQSLPVLAITDEPKRLQRADSFVAPAQINDTLRPAVLELLGLADNCLAHST